MSTFQHRSYFLLFKTLVVVYSAGWLSSCSVVPKNFPENTPFVYEYNINVEDDMNKDDKQRLESGLKNQLDDSIRVRTVNKLIYHGINRPVLDHPPVYKTENAERSVASMSVLLHSLGYFRDSVTYDTSMRIVNGNQYRTSVNFTIKPGKATLLDSVNYSLKDTGLNIITQANINEAIIKKGDPFAKTSISSELDRLVDLYRNNGYMRFSREELIGVWDTLNPAIINPSLDPFEQIALLDSIQKSRANPKANLEIILKPGYDSSKLTKFFVGNITVYPDFQLGASSLSPNDTIVDGVKISYYRNLFKPKILPPNIFFRRGDLFSESQYNKTITRFNSLGSWKVVNIEKSPRFGTDTADFNIKLSPATKYSFSATIEGSRNQSAVSGNLFGVGLNLGIQNRNFAKRAIQTTTNLRFGIEISDSSFIQTQQFSISHNIYFPRSVPNYKWIPEKYRQNIRTIFSFNAGNTERKDLYNLTTVNGSWGYEFQKKNLLLTLRIPNFEYAFLIKRQKLNDLIDSTPALNNIFTDGFISSIAGGITVSGGKNNNLNVFRGNFEESGLVTGLIRNKFLDSNLYRYIKLDAEFVQKFVYSKSSLVLRLFAGVGYELGSTKHPDKKYNLPFFKEYFAGGPNSMRAWGLRRLGQGSTVKEFKATPERYGDLQLEGNIEYRFPFFTISGVKVNGALFTDIGNVWFLKSDTAHGRPDSEVFNLGRLGKDIAIGAGFGLRVDFGYFVVRLDYSQKVKDPSPDFNYSQLQNKWFGYLRNNFAKGSQFQLGISYPFIQ